MTDREKLIELMFSYQDEYNSIVVDKVGLTDYLIANGVTVQKSGQWEKFPADTYALEHGCCKLRCSACAHFYYYSSGDGKRYCPYCGAKMDLEE